MLAYSEDLNRKRRISRHSQNGQMPEDIRPTIVCIDDDPDITVSIEAILGKYSVEISSNRDGEQGLEDVIRRRPDLILTDWLMPELDGEKLVRSIKRNRFIADIPIIVVSCLRGDRMVHRLKSMGVAGFVPKPLDSRNLLRQIENHVDLDPWNDFENDQA